MDEIRQLAESKHFSVRFIQLEGEPLTVIGSPEALDALMARLHEETADLNPDQPQLEGYARAISGTS